MTNRNSISIISNNQTMSSLEIAKLTGKRHDHVMRDITNILAELNINATHFWGTYKTKQGNEYGCYNLPKRETLILVSGYNIQLRAKIIDPSESLRDYLTVKQLDCIVGMQRANTVYIEDGLDFQDRKTKLADLFNRKYKQKLIDEIHLLNA